MSKLVSCATCTAVIRNGEKCVKFTFLFRNKFYLSRKISVMKFDTSCSRQTLERILKKIRAYYTKRLEK